MVSYYTTEESRHASRLSHGSEHAPACCITPTLPPAMDVRRQNAPATMQTRLHPYMEPCRTFIPLLSRTPFFMKLARDQLQWVINHSQEWMVSAGTVVCTSPNAGENLWVLLDGNWEVESGGIKHQAMQSDPGNWYGSERMAEFPGESRVVATSASYVLKVSSENVQHMLDNDFDISRSLERGLDYYRRILGSQQDSAAPLDV